MNSAVCSLFVLDFWWGIHRRAKPASGDWPATYDAERKSPTSFILCIQIIVIIFATIIMVYGGGLLTMDTFDSGQTSPALGWQMGYIYMSIPISGVLIIIYTIDMVLTELKQPL